MFKSLVVKVNIATVAIIVIGIAVLGFLIMDRVDQQVADQSLRSQKLNLRVAALLLKDAYPETKVTIDQQGETNRIVMPEIPDLSSQMLIDQIALATGETATVFKFVPEKKDFIRVTTNIIKPDGQRAVGTMLGEGSAAYKPIVSGKTFRGEAVILGTAYITQYTPIFAPSGDVLGILYVGITKDEVVAAARSITNRIMLTGILVAVVATILLFVWLRIQLGPLAVLGNAISKFADGDFSQDVHFTNRRDETGLIAKGLLRWRDTAGEVEKANARRAELEKNSINERIEQRNRLALELEEAVGGIVNSVHKSSEDMVKISRFLNEATENAAQQGNIATDAVNDSARNVQTVAAATEELSASIMGIGSQVNESTDIANLAVSEASRANEMIGGLAKAAEKIGEVINLINDIAGKTNLLALNATIEAARAGEAGKGFAVVAQEVKNLANQTSRATDDIAQQVGAIQSETRATVEAIEKVSQTIGSISEITKGISSAVSEQNIAVDEIAQSAANASTGTQNVVTSIGLMGDRAHESGRAVNELDSYVGNLTADIDGLQNAVSKFLTQLRQN